MEVRAASPTSAGAVIGEVSYVRACRANRKPRLNRNGKKGRHKGGQNSFSISGDAASHSDGLCLFPNHSDGPDRLGAL
jgi:hypothetical protein